MEEIQRWPQTIYIVRHGESASNVAKRLADMHGHEHTGISTRDVDAPLSELGERQAAALGKWFGDLPSEEKPRIVLTSPYRRARMTTEGILSEAGIDRAGITPIVDERLREKEFGIFDQLTTAGIRRKYPEESARYRALGKFYHRAPGGESWCDVILRLRSVIDTLTREYRGERVLIVCHAVVVYCFRYLFERMTEEQILAIDREDEVANCSVTSYNFDPHLGRHGRLALSLYNFVLPLEEAGEEITTKPDEPIKP